MNLVQRLLMAAAITLIIALLNFDGASDVVASSEKNLAFYQLNMPALRIANR